MDSTKNKKLTIAFGGKMGSGKDCAVQYLKTMFPQSVKVAFSDGIYDILHYAQTKCGFPKVKDRAFLQWVGTDWAHKIDNHVWINMTLNSLPQDKHVFLSDIRFKTELEALKKDGWLCIKLIRTNVDSDRKGNGNESHCSETELDLISDTNWDYIIENNGTIEELYNKLYGILYEINKSNKTQT
jgi:hypothetical protein